MNSSPIDGTGILRSVPTIGRKNYFNHDIDLSALPLIVYNNTESVISYLHLAEPNHFFASETLKILVEDRKTAHAERIKNNRNIVTMHHGDLVMVLTAIQSVKDKDKVAKLSYVVRVPFQSVRGIGCGSYKARKTNTPDCPDLKFMSEDLYILSPSLRSCEPIVSCDSPYLNQSHAPIVNPLKKYLNIELYNKRLFIKQPKTFTPPFRHDHTTLKLFPQELRTPFTTLSKIHAETYTSPPQPLIERIDTNYCSPPTLTSLQNHFLL